MDKTKIQKAVKMIFEAIGENPDREDLKETPRRVAEMYEEILGVFQVTLQRNWRSFYLKSMMRSYF